MLNNRQDPPARNRPYQSIRTRLLACDWLLQSSPEAFSNSVSPNAGAQLMPPRSKQSPSHRPEHITLPISRWSLRPAHPWASLASGRLLQMAAFSHSHKYVSKGLFMPSRLTHACSNVTALASSGNWPTSVICQPGACFFSMVPAVWGTLRFLAFLSVFFQLREGCFPDGLPVHPESRVTSSRTSVGWAGIALQRP